MTFFGLHYDEPPENYTKEPNPMEALVDSLIGATQEMERWYRREPSKYQRAQHRKAEAYVARLRTQLLATIGGE